MQLIYELIKLLAVFRARLHTRMTLKCQLYKLCKSVNSFWKHL